MTSARGWPFPVLVSGRPSRAERYRVRIDAADPAESREVLDSVFVTFDEVAKAGGFGSVTAAWEREDAGEGWLERRAESDADLVWTFRGFPFDHSSLAVLLSALEGTEEPIVGVTLEAFGAGQEPILRVGDCPARTPAVPFEVEEDSEDEHVRVTVEFANALTAADAALITDILEYWDDLGVLGGYRRATAATAGESVLSPMEDVVHALDELAFSLPDTTASSCAFDVLINVLSHISISYARITHVTLS
jgi:hypothetical protein